MAVKSAKPTSGLVRVAALAGALLLAILALGSAGAKANTQHEYCNILLPPGGSCGTGNKTNMEGNVALFPGTKTNLTVCQQVTDVTLGKVVSSTCAVNGTGGHTIVKAFLGDTLFGTVTNGSTVNAHTVRGLWFSP